MTSTSCSLGRRRPNEGAAFARDCPAFRGVFKLSVGRAGCRPGAVRSGPDGLLRPRQPQVGKASTAIPGERRLRTEGLAMSSDFIDLTAPSLQGKLPKLPQD